MGYVTQEDEDTIISKALRNSQYSQLTKIRELYVVVAKHSDLLWPKAIGALCYSATWPRSAHSAFESHQSNCLYYLYEVNRIERTPNSMAAAGIL